MRACLLLWIKKKKTIKKGAFFFFIIRTFSSLFSSFSVFCCLVYFTCFLVEFSRSHRLICLVARIEPRVLSLSRPLSLYVQRVERSVSSVVRYLQQFFCLSYIYLYTFILPSFWLGVFFSSADANLWSLFSLSLCLPIYHWWRTFNDARRDICAEFF